jgi:hypothetical protein
MKIMNLRIMPEFFCSPIWISDNLDVEKNIEIEELNISRQLKEKLFEYDNLFQSIYNDNYPPDSRFLTVEDKAEFLKLQSEISEDLLNEIGSTYHVVFDFSKNEIL